MSHRIPKTLFPLTFAGFGGSPSRGLVALDQRDRMVLTDAEDNPGTSMTNAIENAVGPARQQLGIEQQTEVFLWTPDDPVAPDSVWRVSFTSHGADFAQVENADDDLMGAVEALRKTRGR